ncbi:hypothetical protein O3P69_006355 [Scylla paramamosain]|uniref:Uncharacterized protein n=1 Tax=Scylla paramamosain TaxID=85552 RepID=A0AAW0U3V1_SCYPA
MTYERNDSIVWRNDMWVEPVFFPCLHKSTYGKIYEGNIREGGVFRKGVRAARAGPAGVAPARSVVRGVLYKWRAPIMANIRNQLLAAARGQRPSRPTPASRQEGHWPLAAWEQDLVPRMGKMRHTAAIYGCTARVTNHDRRDAATLNSRREARPRTSREECG